MKEELIISGRNLPHIDPYLNLWHWPISLYLFLGGLAAGILFFASLTVLFRKEDQYIGAVKYATIIPPIALSVGLLALIYDLSHPLYVWRLFVSFKIESPMSWGAWVLTLVTILSFVWTGSYFKEYFPNWNWQKGFLSFVSKLIDWVNNNKRIIAWILIPSTLVLGIYTGILLSAFNARPLWNNSILGPLFLISGLSTGVALIILMAKNHEERKIFVITDLLLISVELVLIIHMMVGMTAGSQVQIEASQLFLGGEFTVTFWGFVIVLGMLFPAILEIYELRGRKIPAVIPVTLILIGGIMLRFIMVEAGQITRYLY